MPDAEHFERLRLLKDNADKVEETKYYKDLTSDELDQKRETLVDNLIKLSNLQEQLEGYKESYRGQMKPISDENKTLQMQVKTRKQEIEGHLFHMANHEEGIMETYDESGDLVATRRLRPEEKQPKLFPISKTAN